MNKSISIPGVILVLAMSLIIGGCKEEAEQPSPLTHNMSQTLHNFEEVEVSVNTSGNVIAQKCVLDKLTDTVICSLLLHYKAKDITTNPSNSPPAVTPSSSNSLSI